MAKVCAALPGPSHQQQSTPSTVTPAPPPPRRPRVREVSSRFMSPIVTSSSSGDLHLPSSKHASTVTSTSMHHHNQQRSQSAHRRESQLSESVSYADENRLETARSLDIPFGSINKQGISSQKRQQHCDGHQLRPLCSNKFPSRSGNFSRSRADTPVVQSRDRIYGARNSPRSNKIDVASVASTAAAKLVQLSGISTDGSVDVPGSKCSRSLVLDSHCQENIQGHPSSSDSTEPKTFAVGDQESRCNSPVRVQNSKPRPTPEFRSSMSETDMLPTISSKLLAHSRDTPKSSAFPGYRSLNSPLPSYEQPFSVVAKSVSRPSSSSGTCLPTHPSTTKPGIEGRKATKVSNQQEQVHVLRLHYNHHLQWRYANAKAEVAINAQTVAAERSFHAMAAKISELHESVNKKHVELTQLKKEGTISTILEAQMPYLDKWSVLEGEYSNTLAGAVKALQDTSLRLPIIGNVKADIEDVGKALNSASNVMDVTSSIIERFLPKGEELDTLISELAEVVNTERALIGECGDLLSRTHALQMMECSLRGQVLQLKSNNSLQTKAEQ